MNTHCIKQGSALWRPREVAARTRPWIGRENEDTPLKFDHQELSDGFYGLEMKASWSRWVVRLDLAPRRHVAMP